MSDDRYEFLKSKKIEFEFEYIRICNFFDCMKAVHGPEYVNATLRRHKKLALALQDFEKTYIIDLESKLS